jgi:hypothetical protein
MVHHWSDFWQLQPATDGMRRSAGWIGRDLEAWLAALASSDGISSCPASFTTLYRRPDLVYRETTEIEPCEHLLVHRTADAGSDAVVAVLDAVRAAQAAAQLATTSQQAAVVQQ